MEKLLGFEQVLDRVTVAALRQLAEPGGPDPFPEIARCFLENAAARLAQLVPDSTPERIRIEAHSLRGMSGSVGARRLAQACAKLEQAASAPARGTLSTLIESAHLEFARARHALEFEMFATNSPTALGNHYVHEAIAS